MNRSTFAAPTALAFAVAALAAAPTTASAQQSDVAVSPFVSFLPATGASPLAGMALAIAGTGGFGVRGSASLSLENQNNNFGTTTMRPWGADADLVLGIGGRRYGFPRLRTFAPYLFTGIGVAGRDSLGFNATTHNWSYGVGAAIPLGGPVDLFAESRWRMSRYVLPTAAGAPSPSNELRVGISFHVGTSGFSNRRRPAPRDRRIDRTPASGLPARYPASSANAAMAARVIGTAADYVGVPYRYGGTSPATGFDCSGFTQFVFRRQGVALPRTAAEQAQVGAPVAPDWRAVQAGDLVMFEEGGRIGHVAIYVGGNRIIHSSSSGGGVRFDDLSTERGQWFIDHMVAARRVMPDPNGFTLDLARGFADGAGLKLDPPDLAPKPNR